MLCKKKQTILGNERQPDLSEVLYTPKNNGNISYEMNNIFLNVLVSILWYHHAQNEDHVKKTDKSWN